jgi:tRNA 2-thiouridine synthesizing protein A
LAVPIRRMFRSIAAEGRSGASLRTSCPGKWAGKRMAVTFALHLDLRGLSRPKPVLELASALVRARPGDLVEVLTTDPTSVEDFALWSGSTCNDLIESSQFGTAFRFVVRKRAD